MQNPSVNEGENEAEDIEDQDIEEESKSRNHENNDSEIAFADNINMAGSYGDGSMLPNHEQFEHNLKGYPEINAQSWPLVSRTQPKKEDEGIIVSLTKMKIIGRRMHSRNLRLLLQNRRLFR